MAITANEQGRGQIEGGNSSDTWGTFTVTSTYTTNGVAIDFPNMESCDYVHADFGVYVGRWVPPTQKMKLFYCDYDAVADGALIEVADGATITSATGANYRAIGQ